MFFPVFNLHSFGVYFSKLLVTSTEAKPTEKLKQLQERTRRRFYKRRPNAHVNLELAPGSKLMVEVYNLVR